MQIRGGCELRSEARIGTISLPCANDYLALLKPRVMSLVVFTGFAGLVVAPGELHPLLATLAVLCIAAAAGGAGAINMWYDRDIDALMERTRHRPIPAGRMPAEKALVFGVTVSLVSIVVMGVAVNWVAAGLLAFANCFYVFVYTVWLKRRTPQNIVIGGAAGALPPMIGWAAVTGDVSLAPVVLFAIIFMWTPPHFWALALYRSGDYAKAGVPMLPVVAGAQATKRQIMIYAVALVPVTLAPVALGVSSLMYGAGAALMGIIFVAAAWRVMGDTSGRAPRWMFGYSIFYLFMIFVLLIADKGASQWL